MEAGARATVEGTITSKIQTYAVPQLLAARFHERAAVDDTGVTVAVAVLAVKLLDESRQDVAADSALSLAEHRERRLEVLRDPDCRTEQRR